MAATILERLANRRCYPVEIGNDTFHVRSLTIGELAAIDALPPELVLGFVVGSALVEPSGVSVIPRAIFSEGSEIEVESHEDYARRCLQELEGVGLDAAVKIKDAVKALNEAPPAKELAKN